MLERSVLISAGLMLRAASACTAQAEEPTASSEAHEPFSIARPAPPISQWAATHSYHCSTGFPFTVTVRSDGSSATLLYDWAYVGGPYALAYFSRTPSTITFILQGDPNWSMMFTIGALSGEPTVTLTQTVPGSHGPLSYDETCNLVGTNL
jgi:hypothetical protein